MGHRQDVVLGREAEDLHPFAQAAAGADVGLDDVDASAADQVAEAEAGELAFPAGDRNVERRAQAAVAVMVLRRHRLLEPQKPVLLHRAADPDRGRGIVGVVRVRHQPHLRPDRAADQGDPRGVRLDRQQAQLDLDRGDARRRVAFDLGGKLRHHRVRVAEILGVVAPGPVGHGPVAERAAHQVMDRPVQRLAPDVPERDVDGADRLDVGSRPSEIAAERVVPLPDPHRRVRRLADQTRAEDVGDRARDRLSRPVLTAFAPADDPVIRGDLHQRAGAFRKPRLAGIERVGARGRLQDHRLDAGDLHVRPPSPFSRHGAHVRRRMPVMKRRKPDPRGPGFPPRCGGISCRWAIRC